MVRVNAPPPPPPPPLHRTSVPPPPAPYSPPPSSVTPRGTTPPPPRATHRPAPRRRVAGVRPESGTEEPTTVCVPAETLPLIGVTLPVSTPSTDTCAPEGNEVPFNEPFELSATALPGRSSSTPANTAIQT